MTDEYAERLKELLQRRYTELNKSTTGIKKSNQMNHQRLPVQLVEATVDTILKKHRLWKNNIE